MKLKEKLAQEYANKESTCPVNDFIAGFEKAKQMTLAMGVNGHIDALVEDIINLGEEELDTY